MAEDKILCETDWLTVKVAEDKILCETDWLTLVDRDGYIFVKDTTEVAVAVLPFRAKPQDEDPIEFLARIEEIPPHEPRRHLCALTGGVEKGEEPLGAAIRELYEEAGYKAERSALIHLRTVFPSKASTTVMHLFAVDVSDLPRYEAPGDGTEGEETASIAWLSRKKAGMVPDAIYGAMLNRLSLWFQEDFFLG